MMNEKIAVVTGSNKGIGFAIVKGLCQRYEGKVYLTARNVTRGEEAVKKLNALGLKPLFHQLDINDQQSIDKFKNNILKTHGGIDVLINNAAIHLLDSPKPFSEVAEETISTNFFGLLRVCETLFPILRKNGRVINISSYFGHLSRVPSEDLRKKFGASTLTVEKLSELMYTFLSDVRAGRNEEKGWGKSAYGISKVGTSALTFIQQKDFDNEKPPRNISVNCVYPGYVKTDLTNGTGNLTPEEGAVAPLYLALDDHGLKGKYVWSDKSVVDWYAKETPPL